MTAAGDLESGPEKTVCAAVPADHDDEDFSPDLIAKRRIRYFDDDDDNDNDAGQPSSQFGHVLRRQNSTFSVHSISSVRSGQRVVDPAVALPIQYRTLSYNISTTKDKDAVKPKDARDKAAIGKCNHLLKIVGSEWIGIEACARETGHASTPPCSRRAVFYAQPELSHLVYSPRKPPADNSQMSEILTGTLSLPLKSAFA